MKKEILSFQSKDDAVIKYLRWIPDAKVKAVIQIVHGMAEYSSRYSEFAEFLNNHGFAVYANDHRGHGLTAEKMENTGHFADNKGWSLIVKDCMTLTSIIKTDYPGIPVFILGHSMGSFITRDVISQNGIDYRGAILSGTSWNPSVLLSLGRAITGLQKLFYGKRHKSKLLYKLSFGSFNKKFKPVRTDFDWLNRATEHVDWYVKDDFCGFPCSTQFFGDMFGGIAKIQKTKTIKNTPSALPVLLACGENDPVGNFTAGVKQLYKTYKYCGIQDVELKIYLQARHEILNETNRTEVYGDMLRWMEFRI